MKSFILIALVLLSNESLASTSSLSCFGFFGAKASPDTAFAKDIEITSDLNDSQIFFKTYDIINRNDVQISVILNFPQRGISLNVTKNETISMSVGKFEGTKLVLANAETKENLAYAECGIVTKDN